MQVTDYERTIYVQTTSATAKIATSIPMDEDSVARVCAIIICRSTLGYSSTWYIDYAFEHDVSTNVLAVGTGTKSKMGSFNAANYDAQIIANGNYIDIQVTGDTGHTVNWSVSGTIHFFKYT